MEGKLCTCLQLVRVNWRHRTPDMHGQQLDPATTTCGYSLSVVPMMSQMALTNMLGLANIVR